MNDSLSSNRANRKHEDPTFKEISRKELLRFFLVIVGFQVILFYFHGYLRFLEIHMEWVPTSGEDPESPKANTSLESEWLIDPSFTRILESLSPKQRKEIEAMEQYFRFEDSHPIDSSCGIWQQAYIDKHKEHVKPSSIQKAFETWKRNGRVDTSDQYLIHYCPKEGADCGGVADHLFGAFSMFLHSLLTNKTFLIDWPEDVWYPETIDWNASRVMTPILQEYASSRGTYPEEYYFTQNLLNWKPNRIDVLFNMNTSRTEDKDDLCVIDKIKTKLDGHPFVRVLTNHGSVLRQMKEIAIKNQLEEWGLQKHNIYSCLWRFLFPLKGPAYDYTLKYKALLQHPDILSVTVHIRNGDEAFRENFRLNHGLMSKYIECTQAIVRHAKTSPTQRVVFLVISDSELTTDFIAKRFPNETLLTGMIPSHFSTDSARDREKLLRPVTDNMIMSYSSYAVHSQSGFGRLASFVRGNDRRAKMVGEFPLHIQGCPADQEFFFTTMDHMAKVWSLG
eukprot:TRINITY_DN8585_c0_g1_i1.p1 TRINITY_DN8585_c0_g1~~TRINITY_DN8585_c0_g1_i1.p1  ORF type:complete len:506 (+),score=59.92 TRINITY_DN8585_c0_g1_i1:54-1571(+)